MKKVSDAFAIEIVAGQNVRRAQFELLPTDDSGPSMFSVQGADEDFPARKTIRVGRGDRLIVSFTQSERELRLEAVLRGVYDKATSSGEVPAKIHDEARLLLGLEEGPRPHGHFKVPVTEDQRAELLAALPTSRNLGARYKSLADNAIPDGAPVVGDQVTFHRNTFSLEYQWNGEKWVVSRDLAGS